MGLISWFKDKISERKFQNAEKNSANGDTDKAIKLLLEILESHSSAPKKLLDIFHSKIISSESRYVIQKAADLYSNHKELEDDCLSFNEKAGKEGRLLLAINYASLLYEKRLFRVKPLFIEYSTQYILNNGSLNTLSTLSKNQTLLNELHDVLFKELKSRYSKGNDLVICLRLACLIKPYYDTDATFVEIFINVRLDKITSNEVTKESVFELNSLLQETVGNLKLTESVKSNIFNKSLLLAKELYANERFLEALLVSTLLLNIFPETETIYIESAYNLYKNKSAETHIVDVKQLCELLGGAGVSFLNALKRFVPFTPYKEIYRKESTRLLNKYAKLNNAQEGIELLKNVWAVVPSSAYFEVSISSEFENYSQEFVTYILTIPNSYLSESRDLDLFVEKLISLTDVDFIVSSLEALLPLYERLESIFVVQLLRLIEDGSIKDNIKVINRGLSLIDNQRLIKTKSQLCNQYIDSENYDRKFITAECKSLIGKDSEAEVLLAQLAIDYANSKTTNLVEKEAAILEALSYKNNHNTLFNQESYNKKLSEINNVLSSISKQWYDKNERDRAVNLLYTLRDNGLEWFDMYGRLRLSCLDEFSNFESTLDHLYAVISEGKNTGAKVLDTLWNKMVSINMLSVEHEPVDTKIKIHTQLLEKISENCEATNRNALYTNVQEKLLQCYLDRAREMERSGKYNEAIKDYIMIYDQNKNQEASYRLGICRLKSGRRLLEEHKANIKKLLEKPESIKCQQDLAFRWCLYLIKNNQIEEAENINERVLKKDTQILDLCNDAKLVYQESLLKKINVQLLEFNTKNVSAEKAVDFGKGLSKSFKEMKLILTLTKAEEDKLKEAVRRYAIVKYYEQSDLVKCYEGIKRSDSDYLSEPLTLRNVAIISLRAAESNLLNQKNYKELLSIWVTAIYQQSLFVQSLAYTPWDDDYTFSLHNALGKLDKNSSLPDNVGHSYSENVVFIRDVQRELITRMETALNSNARFQNFYLSQIEAIEKLSDLNISDDLLLIAPHMMDMSPKYKDNITNILSSKVNGHNRNREQVLAVGNLYNIKGGEFTKYNSALQNRDDIISVIEKPTSLKRAVTKSKIRAIQEYPLLMSSLLASLSTVLNKRISKDPGYLKLTNEFNSICEVLNDDSFSFSYSNYINQDIVRLLNNKKLSIAKGAETLIKVYKSCKINPHLKRNLSNIIESLIHNYLMNGDLENLTVLDSILISYRDFDQNVINALTGDSEAAEAMLLLAFASNESRFNTLKSRIGNKSPIINSQFKLTSSKMDPIKRRIQLNNDLNNIINDVNNNTIEKCDALDSIYNIYKNNRDNDVVCKNLSTLIPICVTEYIIGDRTGKHTVIHVLDSLKANRSWTFRANSSEIKKAYDEILWHLPNEVRQILQNSNAGSSLASIGISLTDEGLNLQKGLDYLKELS